MSQQSLNCAIVVEEVLRAGGLQVPNTRFPKEIDAITSANLRRAKEHSRAKANTATTRSLYDYRTGARSCNTTVSEMGHSSGWQCGPPAGRRHRVHGRLRHSSPAIQVPHHPRAHDHRSRRASHLAPGRHQPKSSHPHRAQPPRRQRPLLCDDGITIAGGNPTCSPKTPPPGW